jgi:hypothetical protein
MTRNPLVRHLPPGAPGLTEDSGPDENLARLARVHLACATFARRRVSEAQARFDGLRSSGTRPVRARVRKDFRSLESGTP